MAWSGEARPDRAGRCLDWRGITWCGEVWRCTARTPARSTQAGASPARWLDKVRYGSALRERAWLGMTGVAWFGAARKSHHLAWHGPIRYGTAGSGAAWHGPAWVVR